MVLITGYGVKCRDREKGGDYPFNPSLGYGRWSRGRVFHCCRALRVLLPTATTYLVFLEAVKPIVLDIGTYRYPFGRPSSAMLSFAISQFPFTPALLLLISGGQLEAKSVIVDDSDTSRITYSSGWNIGNNCTTCFAEPDSTQPSNGTWHECV